MNKWITDRTAATSLSITFLPGGFFHWRSCSRVHAVCGLGVYRNQFLLMLIVRSDSAGSPARWCPVLHSPSETYYSQSDLSEEGVALLRKISRKVRKYCNYKITVPPITSSSSGPKPSSCSVSSCDLSCSTSSSGKRKKIYSISQDPLFSRTFPGRKTA